MSESSYFPVEPPQIGDQASTGGINATRRLDCSACLDGFTYDGGNTGSWTDDDREPSRMCRWICPECCTAGRLKNVRMHSAGTSDDETDDEDTRPRYPPCSSCGDDNYPFHPKVDFVDLNGETFWYCGPCSELREEELKAAKEKWAKIKAVVKNE